VAPAPAARQTRTVADASLDTGTSQGFPSAPPMSTNLEVSAMAGPESSAQTKHVTTVGGHPIGLYMLFGTELWERFSYYGMRALLVLYLVQHHGWQPSESSSVYKWYTSLVYLTPLVGGLLADRYLGLRASIAIGGVLMAIGHILMAFEPLPFFYTALAFLIAGNGFFKPNISTLVGKMYKDGDSRRDAAFTIFYMGINLGALLAPLVCGALRAKYGFHYGFGAAGIGMLIGLGFFLVGQKQIVAAVDAAGHDLKAGKEKVKEEHTPEPDENIPGEKGFAGGIARVLPFFLIGLAVLVPLLFIVRLVRGEATITELLMPTAFAAIGGWMGVNLLTIKGRPRDKSSVIFTLFFFVVLFWMAFEQAGNALNLWAEFHTERALGPITLTAENYQSANPIMIVAFAPLFAMLWGYLGKKGLDPSTPAKMLIAMVFMALSFFAMVTGAATEASTVTEVKVEALPASVKLDEVNGGRIQYDEATKTLSVRGVLPSYAVRELLKPTVPAEWVQEVDALEKESAAATETNPVAHKLERAPQGFALPALEGDGKKRAMDYDVETGTLKITRGIDAPTKIALIGAGAPAEWREPVQKLAELSNAARVTGFWLLLSYLLATFGELCLSPVGLSMVTKLAPARFASLFMGVWMLASSVAQYVGGSIGESWGRVAPTSYFMLFVYTSIAGAVVLAAVVVPLRKLMHGVR
jgi:POT family proton-dependent oligopeptide transporter